MGIKYGIIGCGLIGDKRASAITACEASKLAGTFDIDQERSEKLAAKYNTTTFNSVESLLADRTIQAVVVATTNNKLAEITLQCIKAGKHVLVEKPAATSYKELKHVCKYWNELPEADRPLVRVGFNLRLHRAFLLCDSIIPELGPLMHIRARYGHGGRPDYDKEWRANKEISGGGELIDQGVHLIDLAAKYLGRFDAINGCLTASYWNMSDDNAFMLLQTKTGQVAWLHASCTEWKNTFSFEIFGKNGKLQIDGLCGSYGTERLTYYKMLTTMGPPDTTIWEFPTPDNSWKAEINSFSKDIMSKTQPQPNLTNALEVLRIVQKLQELQSSKTC